MNQPWTQAWLVITRDDDGYISIFSQWDKMSEAEEEAFSLTPSAGRGVGIAVIEDEWRPAWPTRH